MLSALPMQTDIKKPAARDLDEIDGRRRVVIEGISPEVDGGRYTVKRVAGERVTVEVDLLIDGHDHLAGRLMYRKGDGLWNEEPLVALGNDRFRASFLVGETGLWQYGIAAWVDAFATWAWGLGRKAQANQDVEVELQGGAALVASAAERARRAGRDDDARALDARAKAMKGPGDQAARTTEAASEDLARLMATHADRSLATTSPPREVIVDPVLARFSSWYEFFPRSAGADGRHGTFADAEKRLPYVRDLGFDVVYLPPIHPIGTTFRKGPNNTLTAGPNDPGSPWAIGGREGGHTGIHPQLGTPEDFRRFVTRAREMGMEVALDIAFQASPDHPYVKEHPDWFVHRADGTIQYAENPPKKYQDVYPFDFGGEAWRSLWVELRGVFLHWIGQGVRVFRVDNPHTKPIPFWEWCIRTIKDQHPDVLFLAEAFTRPKLTAILAKVGFSQSYTYFTWRTTKAEFVEYLTQLTRTELREYFRPNFWPNTPDILPEHLQWGGRPMFIARAVLASTLTASWGIYGPAFELLDHVPREGVEEYVDNEKYQLRQWDLNNPDSIAPIIRRLNRMRKENPALQTNERLVFHPTDNDFLLAYSKTSADGANAILVIVNLDTQHTHGGWVDLDLAALGLTPGLPFQVHDLLSDARYQWAGGRAYVQLDPNVMPAHVFRLRRRVRSEQTFEYYL